MLCASYIHNRCPSFVINNKSPYEMWYNCLPVIQHFRVFGPLCYAFIPKHQRHTLGARSHKCFFLGYFSTSKDYSLYDEGNKKFILSKDVIFLECDEDNYTVDRQLTHLEKFSSKRFYFESNNDVPHTEEGVPILDQSVVLPSLNHESVIVEEHLDESNVSEQSKISLDPFFQDEQPSQCYATNSEIDSSTT